MLRIYYVATSRSIKRLEGVSKLIFYICLAFVVQLIVLCNKLGWDGMDWIDLAQDRDQWRAIVNTVMNLWVP
jgi:hypothetical protein